MDLGQEVFIIRISNINRMQRRMSPPKKWKNLESGVHAQKYYFTTLYVYSLHIDFTLWALGFTQEFIAQKQNFSSKRAESNKFYSSHWN